MLAAAVDPAVLAAAFAAVAVFAAAAVGAAAFVERDAALGADGQGKECRCVYAQHGWENEQMFLAGQSAFDL